VELKDRSYRPNSSKKVRDADPLMYPKCQAEMRIVASSPTRFIEAIQNSHSIPASNGVGEITAHGLRHSRTLAIGIEVFGIF
jgi:hypothetical protein